MYVLIGMGEESQNIEIPCMFFETREDAEIHLSGIPWLHRCENNGAAGGNGMEDPTIYNDQAKRIIYYVLMQVQAGAAFLGFA
jgi:hypothetical protein